jgi:hypothetical protein
MSLFSIWSLVLYVIIPVGLILFLLLSFPPSDYKSEIRQIPPHSIRRRWGFIRKNTNKLVERVLFTRLGVLPTELINFLLVGLTIMLIVLGVRVYDDHQRKGSGIEKMLDTQLLLQGQVWRRQRNLYLTALSLVLWYAVMVVHSLQVVLLARDEALQELVKNKNIVENVRRGVINNNADDDAAAVEEEKNEVEMQPRQRVAAAAASEKRKDR